MPNGKKNFLVGRLSALVMLIPAKTFPFYQESLLKGNYTRMHCKDQGPETIPFRNGVSEGCL